VNTQGDLVLIATNVTNNVAGLKGGGLNLGSAYDGYGSCSLRMSNGSRLAGNFATHGRSQMSFNCGGLVDIGDAGIELSSTFDEASESDSSSLCWSSLCAVTRDV
jgi:hypothetical protein